MSEDEAPLIARELVVRGARTHNLRAVDLRLPHEKLIVFTGPSGSGKSSLAFHTIFAEGQRRYVESLSAHARRFLSQLPKPPVDLIDGLRPALSVEQRAPSRNPRSTVATATEISDHLRVLFARVGDPHCPTCEERLTSHSAQDVVESLLERPPGSRFIVEAPVVREGTREEAKDALDQLRRDGYVRVRVDGRIAEIVEIDVEAGANEGRKVSAVIDRLSIKEGVRARLTEAIELAYRVASGWVEIHTPEGDVEVFHETLTCSSSHPPVPPLTPAMFSFNSREGACPQCEGLGQRRRFIEELIVPDPSMTLREGAVAAWGKAGGSMHRDMLEQLAGIRGVSLDKPFAELSPKAREIVLRGDAGTKKRAPFEGVIPSLERRAEEYARRKTEEGGDPDRIFDYLEREIGRFAEMVTCEVCGGTRLTAAARHVRVAGFTLPQLLSRSVEEARETFADMQVAEDRAPVAARLIDQIETRLRFLDEVGLGYVELGRAMPSLSGGESQRVRLATQIGAALSGVLYVLDEPSVGLHPADVARLVRSLHALRDRGNTLLVVEHDEAILREADVLVDLGPGAGRDGGRVLASGPTAEVLSDPASPTGAALRRLARERAEGPPRRRERAAGGPSLRVRNASLHNLRGVDVSFPVGALTCVVGVSGSGKSSLVTETLVPRAREVLNRARSVSIEGEVLGLEQYDKLVQIDQSPIGRTPRSNPASYVGVLGPIRELFAALPEARARGFGPARFSFNTKGGRCERCKGDGVVRVGMHFLPDVEVRCSVCDGARFNRETLEIRYRGFHIADVLSMDVREAGDFFAAHPAIAPLLETMRRIGLGHLQLGRSATTLSGGEAQRIKLARELSRRSTGRTLYVLDEPTTGLHLDDVDLLLELLRELVRAGNTVIVIEHDLRVLSAADWAIELGPGGGKEGGALVYEGPPSGLVDGVESATATALAAFAKRLEQSH